MSGALSCSYPTDDSPYPGQCAPLHPVAFVPLPAAIGVPTDVTLRITFDDYPDPDLVRSNSLLLTTGFFWVPGTYGADLVGKAAVVRPIRWLSADLGYTLHLRPALGSLAGCAGTSEEIDFVTGDGPLGAPAEPTPSFAEVQALFDLKCGGGCHLDAGDAEAACLAAPAGGLSLCAPDAWGSLVDVPSRQSDRLPLVAPGDAARSYLLRKLLPAVADGGRLPGVYGQRDPPGEPLAQPELRLIAAWIDGGAARPAPGGGSEPGLDPRPEQ